MNHGKLRNPDHPDQILEGAAADKIRNCRNPHRQNRQVAFLRMHGYIGPHSRRPSGVTHLEFESWATQLRAAALFIVTEVYVVNTIGRNLL